jgi:hypothetical protein
MSQAKKGVFVGSRVLSIGIAPLLAMTLIAQESPPAAGVPGTNATAAAPGPVELPGSSLLRDGTPLKLRLRDQFDSRTAKTGDEIQFEVVNNVVTGGVTVLKRGASVVGMVTDAAASKTLGRAGRLSFVIRDIPLSNGSKVAVRAFNRSGGENTTGQMVAMMVEMPMVSAPFLLLMHGSNTTFIRGTEINAFVNGDVKIDLNSFGSAPEIEAVKK